MQRFAKPLIGCALVAGLVIATGPIPACGASQPSEVVETLLRAMAGEVRDAEDRVALEQLIAVFSGHGTVRAEREGPWVELTFNREGELEAVAIQAERLVSAPPLIQRAVILHELAHLQRAKATRRALNNLPQPTIRERSGSDQQQPLDAAQRLREIVRILVDDEYQAYRREIKYLEGAVNTAGGLRRYLTTLPPAQRRLTQEYYQRSVQPFVTAQGDLDELRLRRDLIFLKTFPRRYRRYYEAALAWEALQGHVEIQRSLDGTLRPARLLSPTAFLAWLVP